MQNFKGLEPKKNRRSGFNKVPWVWCQVILNPLLE